MRETFRAVENWTDGHGVFRVVRKFCDLQMLVSPVGRERTREEFAVLFTTPGLALTTVTPTTSELSLIEAVPRSSA